MARHTMQDLYELQALPLDLKIRLTKQRIREWIRYYGTEGVYVSFSGGKDSTVLLDIVREDYPEVKNTFFDSATPYCEELMTFKHNQQMTCLFAAVIEVFLFTVIMIIATVVSKSKKSKTAKK